MRNIIKGIFLSSFLLVVANINAQEKTTKNIHMSAEKKETHFHSLLFWLDPALPPEKVKEFEQFFIGLSKLPYQKNLHYGVPAKSSPRAVLDQTFTYNCTMEFDSLEDLETYGKMPEHLALVAKYKPYFIKMKVYDTAYIK